MAVQSIETLGQCRTIHNKGTFTVTPGMTVADVERDFDDVYGLSVEIMKRSGDAWAKAESNTPLASYS